MDRFEDAGKNFKGRLMFETIWDGFSSKEDIANSYQFDVADLNDAEILIAKYETGNYEGYSVVLLLRGNDLFEVHGSHCSCYGLEGQWDEEATFMDALRKRDDRMIYASELDAVEKYLKERGSMVPETIRLVEASDGEILYALKNGGSPATNKSFTVQLFENAAHYDAYKEEQSVKALRERALAKLSDAERKALGL